MKRETARKWLKQAFHDLLMAEKIITIGGYDVAAFLAHQAVEKLLKSMCIIRSNQVPRTHHLDELARDLDLPDTVFTIIYELIPDYTFSRYPDVSDLVPYEQYTESVASAKVAAAKRVFDLVQKEYEDIL